MQTNLRIIRFIVVVAAILFMTLILLSYAFEDKINTITVEALNKNLKSEIKVGAISFSVIRNFPYASVVFNNIKCVGSHTESFPNQEFFVAKKVKLLFSLTNLFSSNYHIKKIIVTDASLKLLADKGGRINYDIFKPNEKEGSVSFEIEKAELENIHFYQYFKAKRFEEEIHFNKLIASGNFTDDIFSFSLNTNAFVHFISSNNQPWLSEKNIELTGIIAVDQKANKISFNDANAKVEQLSLNGKGEIITNDTVTKMNLFFSSSNTSAKELLSVLPKGILPAQFNDYQFKGNVNAELSINGTSSNTDSPVMAFRFSVDKTDIVPENTQYALRNVATSGFFTTKKSEKNPVSYLHLQNFSALLENKPVMADIEIENFSNPYYRISAVGEISIATLLKYVSIDTLETASGILKINGQFKGQAGKTSSYISSGYLEVKSVSFRLKHKPVDFKNFNGSFAFNGNDVTINSLSGAVGKSNIEAKGSIKNLYSWMLQEDQHIYVEGDIATEVLYLDELMQSDINTDTITKLDFADDLELDMNIRAQKATFKKFTAEQITGSFNLKNKILSTNSIRFNAVDGNVYLQGSINANKPDSLLITYDASIKVLNIQKLFYQMGNFGQDILTEKNLKGSVTSTIQFASVWSKQLYINKDKIYATADITISNGELINFDPMLKLSKFVKGTDLRNIKFSTLRNNISIGNQKIMIPVMEINSTALNITASGIHSFENVVDYKIKLRMSELLGKKVKNLNTEFGTIEDDGMGSLNLLLSMKGPLENPKFSYDKKSVEENITKNVKEGKDNFLKIIKEEFKNNEPKKKIEEEKKQEELKLETDE